MYRSIYREAYKLSHKKVTWFSPLLVLILMLALGFSEGKVQPKLLVMTCFGASEGILLVLVIVASSIFSMEFQNQAILTVMYKAPSKLYVYFSKLLVIFVYNGFLHLTTIIFTVILASTPIIEPTSWLGVYQHQQPLIVNMFMASGVDLIASTLIISLIFLMSVIINSNATVVTLNIIIVFMGSYVSYNLMLQNSKLINVLKWNPLNMSNLTQQYYNASMIQATNLDVMQLTIGTLAYTLFFFMAGYFIFRKKRF